MGFLSDLGTSNALANLQQQVTPAFNNYLAAKEAASKAPLEMALQQRQMIKEEIAMKQHADALKIQQAAEQRAAADWAELNKPVHLDTYLGGLTKGKSPELMDFYRAKYAPFAEEGPSGLMIRKGKMDEVSKMLAQDKGFALEENIAASTAITRRMNELNDDITKTGDKIRAEIAANPQLRIPETKGYAELAMKKEQRKRLSDRLAAQHEEYLRLTRQEKAPTQHVINGTLVEVANGVATPLYTAPPDLSKEPLMTVVGPDGKPAFAPRSQAAGMAPYVEDKGKWESITMKVGDKTVSAQKNSVSGEIRPVATDEPYRPAVQINVAGKLDEKVAEGAIKDLPTAKEAALAANNNIGRIDKMLGLIDAGAAGKWGQIKAVIAPYAEASGYVSKSLSDAQTYALLAKTLGGSMRMEVVGPGQVSNYENQLLQKISGGGGAAPAAARELLLYYKGVAKSKVSKYNKSVDSISKVAPSTAQLYEKIPETQSGGGSGGNVGSGKPRVKVTFDANGNPVVGR